MATADALGGGSFALQTAIVEEEEVYYAEKSTNLQQYLTQSLNNDIGKLVEEMFYCYDACLFQRQYAATMRCMWCGGLKAGHGDGRCIHKRCRVHQQTFKALWLREKRRWRIRSGLRSHGPLPRKRSITVPPGFNIHDL